MRINSQNKFLNTLEPWFDYGAFVGFILTFLLAISLREHNTSSLLVFINTLPTIILALLVLLKKRLTIVMKAFTVILILVFLAAMTLYLYGFSSSGFIVLILANFLSIIFLTPILISFIAFLSLAVLAVLIYFVNAGSIVYSTEIVNRVNMTLDWVIQSVNVVIIFLAMAFCLFGIKKLIFSLLEELEGKVKHIENQAFIDPLTKLLTRSGFTSTLEESLSPSRKGIFLLFDIKDFKSINTLYGTDVGDEVLVIIGKILKDSEDEQTTIARFGSNEFAIYTENHNIEDIKERFVFANKSLKTLLPIKHTLIWHVVYVQYPKHADDFKTCYENATIAIKQMKDSNKPGFVAYQPSMREIFENESLIKEHLKTALSEKEFYSVFQKKINAKTNELVGVEALTRWQSKALGFIPPSVFISLLTKSNLMHIFSKVMIEYTMIAFQNAKHLEDHINLSINISPTFVASPDFADIIIDAIKISGLAGQRVILEITEDVMIYDLKDLQEKVKILKEYGVRFSLDDFGTGFSSLKYLTAIEFDEIKIDKTFIDNILTQDSDYELLKSIIALANVLNYNVVAEGVETKDQLDAVLEAGCHMIQGYYYAKPEKLEDIEA